MANEPRIEQNYIIPIVGSSITASNVILSASAVQVLSADPSRKRITFHNPNYDSAGGVDLLISQTSTPTFAAPGGGFVVFGGASLPIEGDAAQGPWYARGRTGTTNGITIMTSMK